MIRRLGFHVRTAAFACSVLAFTAVSRPAAAQNALSVPGDLTYAVQSQLVQIYFTVTEGKRRVPDVPLSALVLTEDGRPQSIERLDTGNVPLQVALLLDSSESMRDSLPVVQKAAEYFLASLVPQDRVTLVTFNSDVRAVAQETDDRTPVLAAIRDLRAAGNTRLFDALLFAMKHLSGKEGRKAIVSFSDGEDTARSASLDVVRNAAALYGFPIYTIGAGSGLSRDGLKDVLKQLAEVNSAASYFVKDPASLRGTFAEIAEELRSAYVLSYYTAVPLDGRWHETKINVANPLHRVSARKGFFARPEMSPGLLSESKPPSHLARADFARPARPVTDPHAIVAFQELQSTPLPAPRDLDRAALQAKPASEPAEADGTKRPSFKVESRFVEVPVLVESLPGQTLPELAQKDFRVYEDNTLQEVAFFRKAATRQELSSLREDALKRASPGDAPPVLADARELILGRTYLVVDNTSSEAGALLRSLEAAAKIIAEHHSALRPISLHLTSESTADVDANLSADEMLRKLKKVGTQSDRELTTNDGIMSINDAYLIERGDRQAQQVAELRLAASLRMDYTNELGHVDGPVPGDAGMIQSTVRETSDRLIARNFAQANRTLDALKSVVGAASTDPGEYPKTLVFLSSGFTLGRNSSRADVAMVLGELAKKARAHNVRFITVNAAGLETDEMIGIGASGAFMVNNPAVLPVLASQSTSWRHEREAPLAQLAQETGGKFVQNTNDLVLGAGLALGGTGQLYYLGFLSSQPIDGRFHRIRVLAAGNARVHTRRGFYARALGQASSTDSGAEDLETLVTRAEQARKSGDLSGVAQALDKVARKIPDNPDVWYNLASARMALKDPEAAIMALQKAFTLSPEDKLIGSALARALVAGGYREAAADALLKLVRKHPRDIPLLVELGRVYEADSRLTDAYQVYRSVLDITLAPPLDVYLLLTRTSVQLGRRAEANLFIRDFLSRGGTSSSMDQWRRALDDPLARRSSQP